MIRTPFTLPRVVLYAWLCLLLSGICFIFWQSEWKYREPTPVPAHYKQVSRGTTLNIDAKFPGSKGRPVLLHFFNPDCPCSRFNMPHFKSLVKKYKPDFYIALVAIDKKKQHTAGEIQRKYGLEIPVVFDTAVAGLCGVYSTPQAVLLDRNHQLYFRGNYNRNRYCTSPGSDFTRIAIDSLLKDGAYPQFDAIAYKAYGCQIFSCTKK